VQESILRLGQPLLLAERQVIQLLAPATIRSKGCSDMQSRLSLVFSTVLLVFSTGAFGQVVVYDSLTTHSITSGHGAYGIDNINNGTVGALGTNGTYNGASPTFEFLPTGITAGEVLKSFVVPIGDDFFTGVNNFQLTLFTSGASPQSNPTLWTYLGSWSGQTDGTFNSSGGPVTVATTPVVLTNSNYYYLMATADAFQGLDGNGNNNLDWGYFGANGPAWETLLDGFRTGIFPDGLVGGMKVLVGPGTTAVPEPGSIALLLSGMMGAGFAFRRRKPIFSSE
jgi:hypothetical protein